MEATSEKKGSQNLYEFLVEHYTSNETKFHKRTRGGSSGGMTTIKSEAYEAWGVYNDEKRIIYFFYNKLASQLPTFGFSVSQCQLLKDKGFLDCDKNRIQKSIKFENKKIRTIALKLPHDEGEQNEF